MGKCNILVIVDLNIYFCIYYILEVMDSLEIEEELIFFGILLKGC